MVHLFDATRGRAVALLSPGRHTVRLRVHLACAGAAVGWDEARALVVADVLLRALEMEGVQVFPGVAVPDLPPPEIQRLDRLVAGYGVRVSGAGDDPRADVHVLSHSCDASAGSGVVLRVGRTAAPASTPPLPQEPTNHDAAARRRALLATHYREPLTVSETGLRDAATALAGWRTSVAAWSRSPSSPVPSAIRDRARSLLGADLDTQGLLGLLDEVAHDPGLLDGTRFEVFVWLDQVLGLELSRDLGHG
ncbi:hypothetical protein DN069_02010 [Streptacidiphilus pinicola]|uniref:Cysteinyl-tRNA synthetase n=1 Tax=Streptacidiphilus pinicola TaxID=2219663 RepID=A0A2X0IV77_9ACTN|nr:hypothetical protein [Streptacidiphilus pinicola]RAG87321.1 hypothetical protein DN069_02010 [Streptacidiphilus pinicola]